jgi:phosphatidylglycerol:prolipoprotein diacylglycerol transferase
VYELLYSVALAWWLWRRAKSRPPVSVITGEYLVLSGVGRFLVEFLRINPKLYWGMSNAQVAALGSILAGAALVMVARAKNVQWDSEMVEVRD